MKWFRMDKSVFNKIISRRIIYLMEVQGLSAEKLAYQSGISKGSMSQILRGLTSPGAYTIFKICCGLNIEIKEFYNFSEIGQFQTLYL